jgi:lipopolysaccharide export system protein LptA
MSHLSLSRCLTLLALLGSLPAAWAEKADRNLPMVVESDGKQAAKVDLNHKLTTISGNVTMTQGSLLIKADRIEVREDTPGKFTAHAQGLTGQPASFRQKRDRADEYVEAQADQINYDGAAERVVFIGDARLRVLRAGKVTDEASAQTISYDQRADTIVFEGGGQVTPGLTEGRARLVFTPRSPDAPASAPEAPAPQGSR